MTPITPVYETHQLCTVRRAVHPVHTRLPAPAWPSLLRRFATREMAASRIGRLEMANKMALIIPGCVTTRCTNMKRPPITPV